jgi:hypothetical protein
LRASCTRRDLTLLLIDTRLLSLRGHSQHHNEPPLEHHSTATLTTREAAAVRRSTHLHLVPYQKHQGLCILHLAPCMLCSFHHVRVRQKPSKTKRTYVLAHQHMLTCGHKGFIAFQAPSQLLRQRPHQDFAHLQCKPCATQQNNHSSTTSGKVQHSRFVSMCQQHCKHYCALLLPYAALSSMHDMHQLVPMHTSALPRQKGCMELTTDIATSSQSSAADLHHCQVKTTGDRPDMSLSRHGSRTGDTTTCGRT